MDVNEELKYLGKLFFWGGGWSGPVWVGQAGCEQRIEIFRKIIFFFFFFLGGGSGWWGVRVDKNEELTFLGKFKKKKIFWGLGVGSSGGQVDLNEELKLL